MSMTKDFHEAEIQRQYEERHTREFDSYEEYREWLYLQEQRKKSPLKLKGFDVVVMGPEYFQPQPPGTEDMPLR